MSAIDSYEQVMTSVLPDCKKRRKSAILVLFYDNALKGPAVRVLEYEITSAEDGWSVEHFLRIRLQFGKKQISRLKFREKGLLLNGVQCRTTQLLKAGDRFVLTLDAGGKRRRNPVGFSVPGAPSGKSESDAGRIEQLLGNPKENSRLQILYEDQDLLAVFKPGGIPVHPSHGHQTDTLWNQVVSLQEERGECWTPRVVGRLDKDTSGIVLFAKNTEAAAAMAVQREQHFLRKYYLAETEGRMEYPEGRIDRAIERDPAFLNKMKTGEEGLPAETRYRVWKYSDDTCILELELEHGRTHQIRVHLASEGHPLVGDTIYNPAYGEDKEHNLHLCAWRVAFSSPFSGERIELQVPVPGWAE